MNVSRLFSQQNRFFTPPPIFWVAVLVRFVLMALAGHNDAQFIPWLSYPILEGNFQLYSFLETLRAADQSALHDAIWVPNPPLTYYTLAAWMGFWKITGVLDTAGWTYESVSFLQLYVVPRMLFVTRLLYFGADLAVWGMLRRLVDPDRRGWVDLLWLFSPLTLVGIYVLGQTDILPIFWVMLFLTLARKILADPHPHLRLRFLALLTLGIGAAYKLWPLFLVPTAALMLEQRLGRRLALIVAGILPLAVTSAPFLADQAFWDNVLLSHSIGFMVKGQPIWLQNYSLFVLFWTGLHIILFYWTRKWRFFEVWMVMFAILLAFFTLNFFWEFYWLLWVLPFFIYAVVRVPESLFLHLVQVIYYLLYMLAGWNIGGEAFMWGILTPREPSNLMSPRAAFFGPDLRIMWVVIPVMFNLFVAGSWGLYALTWLQAWKGAIQAELREAVLGAQWLGWIPFGLFLLYAAAVIPINRGWFLFDLPLLYNRIALTVGRDPHFFAGWALLCLAAAGIVIYQAFRKFTQTTSNSEPEPETQP